MSTVVEKTRGFGDYPAEMEGNTALTGKEAEDGGLCDLCGKPTQPGEQNLHLACAQAENYYDGL